MAAMSVDDFLLVQDAGLRPVGVVVGCSVVLTGPEPDDDEELDALTDARYACRELAMTRLHAQARLLGAEGVVAVQQRIETTSRGLTQVIASGTAVVGREPRRTDPWRPLDGGLFATTLSGRDVWLLVRSGWAPVGIVLGVAVHPAVTVPGATRPVEGHLATEATQATQALHTARDRAMTRLLSEVETLGGGGAVDVRTTIGAVDGRPGVVEVTAQGTAVRQVAAGPEPMQPQPAVVFPLGGVL
jgi:uncharacterized protein YbjQ (UPF0145 family)